MKYGLILLNSNRTDFELGYPGYRIKGILGQKINCHFRFLFPFSQRPKDGFPQGRDMRDIL